MQRPKAVRVAILSSVVCRREVAPVWRREAGGVAAELEERADASRVTGLGRQMYGRGADGVSRCEAQAGVLVEDTQAVGVALLGREVCGRAGVLVRRGQTRRGAKFVERTKAARVPFECSDMGRRQASRSSCRQGVVVETHGAQTQHVSHAARFVRWAQTSYPGIKSGG